MAPRLLRWDTLRGLLSGWSVKYWELLIAALPYTVGCPLKSQFFLRRTRRLTARLRRTNATMTRKTKEQTTTIAAVAPFERLWLVEEADVVPEPGKEPSLPSGFDEPEP